MEQTTAWRDEYYILVPSHLQHVFFGVLGMFGLCCPTATKQLTQSVMQLKKKIIYNNFDS